MSGLNRLRPYIGQKLQVISNTVITSGGELVYTSDNIRHHSRHRIVCVTYGGADCNISIECETCNEVIIDSDLLDVEEEDYE